MGPTRIHTYLTGYVRLPVSLNYSAGTENFADVYHMTVPHPSGASKQHSEKLFVGFDIFITKRNCS